MALSSIAKTSHDGGSIVFTDGTPTTPLTLTVRWDKADFSVDGISDNMREIVITQGRGKLRSVREGAVKQATGSFSIEVSDLSESGTGTILDWIGSKASTPFASRISTDTTRTTLKWFHIKFNQEGTSYGDGADQSIDCKDCYVTNVGFSESEPNTISVSFTIFGDIHTNGAVLVTAPR